MIWGDQLLVSVEIPWDTTDVGSLPTPTKIGKGILRNNSEHSMLEAQH